MTDIYTVEVRSSPEYVESYGRIAGVFSSYWEAIEEIRKMKRRKEFQRTNFINSYWYYRPPTKREAKQFPTLVGMFVHNNLANRHYSTLKDVPESAAHSYIFINSLQLNPVY